MAYRGWLLSVVSSIMAMKYGTAGLVTCVTAVIAKPVEYKRLKSVAWHRAGHMISCDAIGPLI